MKRLVLFAAIGLIVTIAACADVLPSPQTVAWNAPTEGYADEYEVAVVRLGQHTVIGVSQTAEYVVDLGAVGLYGSYAVMVRSVAWTDDEAAYSEWIRSDDPNDVVTVDGEARVFQIRSIRPAGTPSALRVK